MRGRERVNRRAPGVDAPCPCVLRAAGMNAAGMNASLRASVLATLALALGALTLGVAACGPGAGSGDGGADAGAGCRSDRECSARGMLCDRVRAVCVECLGDTDCTAAGQRCITSRCVVPVACTSSRICPGQVCDTTINACVDCVNPVDCPTGMRCVDRACVRSTGDACDMATNPCAARGQFCDPATGACVECLENRDCSSGTCSAARRCGSGTTVCAPNEASCADARTRRVCRPDGSAFDALPCAAGQACEGGRCVTGGACTPAASNCTSMAQCCTGLSCRPTPTMSLCCGEAGTSCTRAAAMSAAGEWRDRISRISSSFAISAFVNFRYSPRVGLAVRLRNPANSPAQRRTLLLCTPRRCATVCGL